MWWSPDQNERRVGRVVVGSVLIVLTVWPSTASAQSAPAFEEVGRFYAQEFTPEAMAAHAQNWYVVQDERGLVYLNGRDYRL